MLSLPQTTKREVLLPRVKGKMVFARQLAFSAIVTLNDLISLNQSFLESLKMVVKIASKIQDPILSIK